jgi:DNA-binding XRE family transcriptional regulator
MKRKTNFDLFLEKELRDPEFAERFRQAGEAWDVAMNLAALREKAGLSQSELARRIGTTQQQISRLESPAYEGHSLTMLRRVARALDSHVKVVFVPETTVKPVQTSSRTKNGLRTANSHSTKSPSQNRAR